MERPPLEDKGGADDNTDDNEDGYIHGDFSDSGQLLSKEEREEAEGCWTGGFRRGFIMQGLSRCLEMAMVTQRREDTTLAKEDD